MTAVFNRVKYTSSMAGQLTKTFVRTSKHVDYPESEYPDQTGKVWLITGSTGGIGYEVALRLAKKGAKVWLSGRSEEKAKAAVSRLLAEVPSAEVDYCLLDLSDLTTIKPGIAKFLESSTQLNGIIHNAGCMNNGNSQKTKQGYEAMLGTNDIGPFLLQKLLDDVLIESSKHTSGRIVWVSSMAHYASPFRGGVNFADPTYTGCFGTDSYAVSKAVNYIEAVQWSKRHPNANVKSVAVHPGIIKSDLYRNMGSVSGLILGPISWPVEYGAYSELWAALGDCPNNSYNVPWGKVGSVRGDVKEAAHDERGKSLEEWLEKQVQPYF